MKKKSAKWGAIIFPVIIMLLSPVCALDVDVYVKNSREDNLDSARIIDPNTKQVLAITQWDWGKRTYLAHLKGVAQGDVLVAERDGYKSKKFTLVGTEFYIVYLTDDTPPEILNMNASPSSPQAGHSFTIKADVRDAESDLESVNVRYLIPGTNITYTCHMTKSILGHCWEATIPSDHVKEGDFKWRIEAVNKDGCRAETPWQTTTIMPYLFRTNICVRNSQGGEVFAEEVVYVSPDGRIENWGKGSYFANKEIAVGGHLLVKAKEYEDIDHEIEITYSVYADEEIIVTLRRSDGPSIELPQVKGALKGDSITVSADITDPLGVKWAQVVYWWQHAPNTSRQLLMSKPWFSDRWFATIPANEIDQEGVLEFYIQAANHDDKQSYSSRFQVKIVSDTEYFQSLTKEGYNQVEILSVQDERVTSKIYEVDSDGKVLLPIQVVGQNKPVFIWLALPSGSRIKPLVDRSCDTLGQHCEWYEGISVTDVQSEKELSNLLVERTKNAVVGCVGAVSATIAVHAAATAVGAGVGGGVTAGSACVVGAGLGILRQEWKALGIS